MVQASDGPALVGMDSGTLCDLDLPTRRTRLDLGWSGPWIYACDGREGLFRQHLGTGVVERTLVLDACFSTVVGPVGVTFGGNLYSSYEDARCGRSRSLMTAPDVPIGTSPDGVLMTVGPAKLADLPVDGTSASFSIYKPTVLARPAHNARRSAPTG